MSIISRITDWVTTPYTIYLILRDPAISKSAKVRSVIGLVIIFAYIVSPLDIVPDFIPMSGWIDDFIVIPIWVFLMRKFIPDINVVEKRDRAEASIRRILIRVIVSLAIFVFLVVVWLGVLIYLIVRLVTG